MPLQPDQLSILKSFIDQSDFSRSFLVLDLDGTALLEDQGKVFISSSVEKGVRAIHDLRKTVVLNTLRFPLSVIRTVGEAWYQIADVPILTVLLNGSVLGYIRRANKTLEYEELASFPMSLSEIDSMITGISQLLKNGIEELILFFYTREWKEGETIWTPNKARMEGLKTKYMSASQIIATTVDQLRQTLVQKEVCMTSLLVDRPEDTLMAYQHSKRNNFFSRKGVDKAFGVREIAARFDLSLNDSFGAGDTEMDNFLSELGLAIIVGGTPLPYQGKHKTMRVADPMELGEAIKQLALLAQAKSSW